MTFKTSKQKIFPQKYFVLQFKNGNYKLLKEGLTFTEIKKEYPKARPMFPNEKDFLRK